MPSLTNLQLLLALLLPLSCLTNPVSDHSLGPADLPEISGEELQDVAPSEHHNWDKITRNIQQDIKMLLEEQFERDFGEPPQNMTNYASVRMQMLEISPSDGCLFKTFIAQRCLRKIYTGLRTYSDYLIHVERENLTSAQLSDVKQRTTRLLNIIKDKVDDAQIQPNSISALPDGSAWKQRIFTHSVLYHFSEFLKDMTRALKYINKKGIKYSTKNIKHSDWPSEKHPQE